jgi:hypothetical protein
MECGAEGGVRGLIGSLELGLKLTTDSKENEPHCFDVKNGAVLVFLCY